MLKSQRMIKAGIVCPNHLVKEVIDSLYEMKVIQIEDHQKTDDFDIGHPLAKNEELSEQIVKIRSLASNAGINLKNEDHEPILVSDDEIKSYLEDTYENVKQKFEKFEFYKKTSSIYKKKEYLKSFGTTKIESVRIKDSDSIAFFGFVKKDTEKEIKEISETSYIISKDVDGTKLSLILTPSSKQNDITKILNDNLFLSIDKTEVKKIFPNFECEIKTLTSIEKAQKELTNIEKEIAQDIKQIKKDDEEFILNTNHTLEIELEKCASPLKFATSKNNHIISGFMPEKRFDEVKKTLEELTKNKVYVHEIEIKENEEAPVLMKNPKPASSFQALLDMFTLPGYHEADPTLIMAITFPLFFGFMLGDIGYGLISLIIFSLARMKVKKGFMSKLLNILILSSIGTIIFGFVFGEFFGEEVLFGHEIPHLIARASHINEILIISLIIGLIHLNLGLIIGFFNLLHHHGLKHAVLEKVSWMILQIGAALAYVGFTNIIPLSGYIGLIVMLIAAIMIFLGEGVKGILELPAIFSNILSYARLMAVGLASVELALLINEMSFEMIHKGGIMIIFAILILLIGHIINLALGLLGPFLHSLRLHYVEFFGKFYSGGGKRFVAFGDKEKN